jgi:hypothetical protein
MGVPSTYERRPGDLIRYRRAGRGVDKIHLPPWRETQRELKQAESWVAVSLAEEMTIVGRMTYACSYDWVLFRHSAPEGEPELWVVARDSDITVVRTSYQACIGQTAIMHWAQVGVIVGKHGCSPRVKILVDGVTLSHVGFHELELILPTPPGYESSSVRR